MNRKYRNLINAMPDVSIELVEKFYRMALARSRESTRVGDIYTAKQWKQVFNAAADQLVERGV